MAERPIQAYGYVGVSLLKSRIPYQGLLAPMIELAWREVESRIPNWKPGIYRVFVYSLLAPDDRVRGCWRCREGRWIVHNA